MTNATFGPYTPVRIAGDLAFVSGQVGIDPTSKQAEAGVEAQTRQVLKNLRKQLEDNGLNLGQVVKTTVFLTDMADFAAMNEVYLEYFPEPRPARSCVAVAELPRLSDNPLLVEIEAVAYRA
jgi:2-iminobutanoate/2-iminopropanoate deaminase